MRKVSAMVASALAFAAAPLAAQANLVANPGFETGDFTGWEQVNDTSFTFVEGASPGFTPPEGVFQAVFGPIDPSGGGILQDLTTVAGASYDVSFQLGNDGDPPNAFGLFWDGGFVDLDFDLDPFGYASFTRRLVASSGTTTLGFIFYNEPGFFYLDDVSAVAAIPEPATWGLMIVGVGAVGGTLRRRRATVRVAFAG